MITITSKQFPRHLKQWREHFGWTQEDLAKASKLKPSHISHFETGRRLPSLSNFCKLCNAFGIPPQNLLMLDS